MTKTLPLLFALLLLPPPANSMVYSWTDPAGITHYTNKEYEIPLRYRAKVKTRYPEQGDSTIPSIPPQIVPAPQAPQIDLRVQTPPQATPINPYEPAKATQTGFPAEYQQMKKERAARKARRNKEDE